MTFTHLVRVERVPANGKHFRLEADAEARAELAQSLGIEAVEALTAELDVRSLGADAYSVTGEVAATVVQTDVVTLEPVRQALKEAVEITLEPAEETPRGRARTPDDPEEERDRYHNGQIDLGAIAAEYVALGLDPYPRASGAAFEGYVEDDSPAKESPFSALRDLRRDKD